MCRFLFYIRVQTIFGELSVTFVTNVVLLKEALYSLFIVYSPQIFNLINPFNNAAIQFIRDRFESFNSMIILVLNELNDVYQVKLFHLALYLGNQ